MDSNLADFVTGWLSPVNIASLSVKSWAVTIRASAATTVPRRKTKRSPGTTASSASSASTPSRMT